MQIDRGNLPALARGCAILGCGGGGDTELPLVMALEAVDRHGPVTLVGPSELDDEAVILPCGIVGAPTIAEERVWGGEEGRTLHEAMELATGRRIDALMALQTAGGSGLLPVAWAARLGLPLLDADGRGRAFPGLDQQSMRLAGLASGPVILADVHGNTMTVRPEDDAWAERLTRSALLGLGGVSAVALHCMSAADARRATIAGTMSRALSVGAAAGHDDPESRIEGIRRTLEGTILIEGRIRDLERHSDGDFAGGSVSVVGGAGDRRRRVRLEFQSELLMVLEDGDVCAAVPELISVLQPDTCTPIGVEHLRQGERVTVLLAPASPDWRFPEAEAIVGPAAFGYEVSFPHEHLKERLD